MNFRSGMRCIILLSLVLVCTACSKIPHYELSRFISPDTCGGCHTEIYAQWKGSMHRLSQLDMVYLQLALHDLKGLTDQDEIAEAESCVKCHVPLGVITGYPVKLSDDASKISGLPMEGVQCDLCHSSTGAVHLYNAALKYDPGNGEADPGTKRGPFKDSVSSYHKSAYSEFHTGSEICAACHDVRHVVFGTKLETPYEEWYHGPYNSKDPDKKITCQGCHMHQRPGIPATGSTDLPKNPGKASIDGPDRDHVFTHYFIGANTLVPSDAAYKKMALERLTHAATVAIDDMISDNAVTITVKNTGAGHKIPTGLTHMRIAWLEVKLITPGGAVIFLSGGKNAKGYLDDNTIIYNTVFGDGKGNPVMNIAKAREILKDRRISPKGSLVERIKLTGVKAKSFTVRARLLYSLASQEIVDKVLGKGKLTVPVIEMASASKTLSR